WSPESCSSRPAAPLDLRRHALRLHPFREVVQRTREVPDRHRPLRRGGLSWSASLAARRRRDASLASRGGGGGFVRALARHSHLAGGRIRSIEPVARSRRVGIALGGAILSALAGLGLSLLRRLAGTLAAPWSAHALVNSGAYL